MNTLDHIYFQNPWLRDVSAIPKEHLWMHRKLYTALESELFSSRHILAITGLRRVGKSTILKQLVAKLLTSNIAPSRVLYFSFDQPAIVEETGTLEKVIETYMNEIVGKPAERVWVMLDEVQLIPYWQDILKRYYDATDTIKFIVSGSAALFLKSASKESLAGRLFQYEATPLTFSEYQMLSGDHDIIRFLEIGQYPELITMSDYAKQTEYIRDAVVGRVLEIDIPKLFGIRHVTDFERLFWSLLPNSGHIIKTSSLGAELGIKKSTLFRYLSVLEQALLTNTVTNISGSFRSTSRLLRKIYPASSNFLSLSPDPVSSGVKAEIYAYILLSKFNTPIHLFRKREKEIDFVLPEKKLAIEIKFKSQIRDQDAAMLKEYAKEKKYEGILVTRDTENAVDGVECMPLTSLEQWVEKRM